jgi:TfoX/Sxy family transcriptional regulator of competence genes
MATSKATVDFTLDQLAPLPVRARAMFGEYGLYCDEKIVALICDETLFMKPSEVSESFLSKAELAPPYPGAKDYYAVPEDRLEDRIWLQEFVTRTTASLPLPKPKKRRTKT